MVTEEQLMKNISVLLSDWEHQSQEYTPMYCVVGFYEGKNSKPTRYFWDGKTFFKSDEEMW